MYFHGFDSEWEFEIVWNSVEYDIALIKGSKDLIHSGVFYTILNNNNAYNFDISLFTVVPKRLIISCTYYRYL